MNRTLIYGLISTLFFWFIGSQFGILVALGVGLLLLAVLVWSRRAALFTQFAVQAYYIKGDKVKGENYFKKAYKTGMMTPECKIQYSSFCLRENKFEKGRHLLNEIINSSRTTKEDKIDAKHNLSVLVWKEGNLDEAIEIMEEVHSLKPATSTYGTMGVLYLERAKINKNFADIVDFLLEAYDYNESDKTIADNLGETYLLMGEYEKAKEVYEELLTAEFVTPMPYYNYGLVLKALGENEKALENFEKALNCRFTSVLTVTEEMVQAEIDSLN